MGRERIAVVRRDEVGNSTKGRSTKGRSTKGRSTRGTETTLVLGRDQEAILRHLPTGLEPYEIVARNRTTISLPDRTWQLAIQQALRRLASEMKVATIGHSDDGAPLASNFGAILDRLDTQISRDRRWPGLGLSWSVASKAIPGVSTALTFHRQRNGTAQVELTFSMPAPRGPASGLPFYLEIGGWIVSPGAH
jgi:hypothetical protein